MGVCDYGSVWGQIGCSTVLHLYTHCGVPSVDGHLCYYVYIGIAHSGLIKKQTILVAISAASSVFLWALIIADPMNSSLVHWDLIVNALCIWFMLASSVKYWKACTKSLLWCCYRREHSVEKNLTV